MADPAALARARSAQNPKNKKNKKYFPRFPLKNAVLKNRAAHFGDQSRNTPSIDRGANNDDPSHLSEVRRLAAALSPQSRQCHR
jgi:hypothetical protein